MRVLIEYTLHYIKQNKRSSIAIMIAVFMASILMCSICVYEYNFWRGSIEQDLYLGGYWHGELFDNTKGKDLDYIKAHASVEKTLVKGQWYVAHIQDAKRPYLIMRDVDSAYWESMPEKNSVLEGRIPHKKGEIVVSKQYFLKHPKVKIGDTIILPIGERGCGEEILEPRSTLRDEEVFKPQKEEPFTIVGVLDITTSSIIPGYVAMGYLEHKMILPNDNLTIYLRFNNPRTTYDTLPQIAKEIGYTQDEYGQYLLKYNVRLLSKYFIFPKQEQAFSLRKYSMLICFLVIGILVIALFVFIIHNAFELSMKSRIRQLALFKSIGATPKQIRQSIIFEAMVLSIIPIPAGVLTSYSLCYLFFEKISTIEELLNGFIKIDFKFGLPVIIPAILMTFLTIWLSAYIPAKTLCKKLPIEILKNVPRKKGKLKVRRWIKFKKINHELTWEGFRVYRKSFKTALITLTLSYLLLISFLSMYTSSKIVANLSYYNEIVCTMDLKIRDGNPIEQEVMDHIRSHSLIKESYFLSQTFGSIRCTKNEETEALKAIGGFEKIAEISGYGLVEDKGAYRIHTKLVGLDDKTFKTYCETLGVDPKTYYNTENIHTIVYNKVEDTFNSSRSHKIYIPFLKLQEGDILNVNEKIRDSDVGDYNFDTKVCVVTEELPPGDIYVQKYTILQIVPMKVYQHIVMNFDTEQIPRALQTSVRMIVEEPAIPKVVEYIKKIGDKWYGAGDYGIWDIRHQKEQDAISGQATRLMIYSIAGLFAIIGISNAFATIYESLLQRKKEFVMLRAIGMTPKDMQKQLIIEALIFALLPLFMALPFVIFFDWHLIKMIEVSWGVFITYIPIRAISVFILMISTAIVLAYWLGSTKIRKENIVDVIKDETM